MTPITRKTNGLLPRVASDEVTCEAPNRRPSKRYTTARLAKRRENTRELLPRLEEHAEP